MGRPGMSDAMKEDLWRRWRAGESISVISRALGKPPGSVFTVLKHHGGIAPAARVHWADRLSAEERESISRGLEAGASLRSIAVSIGRSASTVSREVARIGAPRSRSGRSPGLPHGSTDRPAGAARQSRP
ncbi:helix-turn-helix domain-containing protein [Nonomuraea fuscirosea]|uniref:helix-turn-helix domain-containing protein n=1 Tax=Nonomuraea fuscirosea TaxID=1291556 RepID=UPI00344793E9